MMKHRYRPTAKFERAKRDAQNRSRIRECVLGDENWQIEAEDLGYYYARWPSSADPMDNTSYGPRFNIKANPAAAALIRPGRRIQVRKEPGGEWEVYKASWQDQVEAGIDPRALEPNHPARQHIYLNAIVNLNSYSIQSSLLVNVFPWLYQTPDNFVRYFTGTDASTQVDFAAYIPGSISTHRYALLVFNITKHLASLNPLEVYASTPISLFTDLSIEGDLQECYTALPTTDLIVPIKAYYLKYGQTEIAGIDVDIDVRGMINVPAGGASGSAPDDATYIIQVPDASLPNAQDLDSLPDGLIKKTTGGVLAGAVSNTDYVPPSGATLDNPTINTGISGTAIDNDPTLAGNSATKVSTQQATKAYIDATRQGLNLKYSVIASTTAALPANTYANGTAGVGATITASAVGVLTIDGQAIVLNDRVLIKNESTAANNGIYVCTTEGTGGAAFVLTRSSDMDQASEIRGAFTFTENGTVNDGIGFVVADPGPFTIGTTPIPWTQFSGAGQITAGTGLQKTGNTISIDSTVTTLTDAQTLSNKIMTQLHLLIGGVKAIIVHAFTSDHTVTIPGDTDITLVGVDTVQTLTGKTLTSPKINEILDSNGNEELKFTATASAVNELTITNAATGNRPMLSVSGGDSNPGMIIKGKGTGIINFDSPVTFNEDQHSYNHVRIRGGGLSTLLYADVSSNNLGIGTNAPNFYAILHAVSTTKASIPAPVMTTTQRDAITTPAAGMLVFLSDQNDFSFYDATLGDWVNLRTPYPSQILLNPFSRHTVVGGTAMVWVSNTSQAGAGYYHQSTPAINNQVSWSVVLGVGTYSIEFLAVKNNSSAIMSIIVDGSTVSTHDLYSAAGVFNFRDTSSSFNISSPGIYTFAIKAASKNASSSNYDMLVSWFQFIRTAEYP